jgi:2-phospho-L-lactate guanylyltransferase (CobY/MobA/RfbA family)
MQAGVNTKVLLSPRLMVDLDTPADLQLVLSKDVHAKKSVSYLRRVTKDHSSSFSALGAVKTGTKRKKI